MHFHFHCIYILCICQTLLSKALFIAFKARTLSVAFSGKRTRDLSTALLFELQDADISGTFQKGHKDLEDLKIKAINTKYAQLAILGTNMGCV